LGFVEAIFEALVACGGMMPNNTFERTSLLSSRFALGQRAAQLSR
jgi:hypothetical protein